MDAEKSAKILKRHFSLVLLKAVLVVVFITGFNRPGYAADIPRIVDGTINLRTWDAKVHGIVKLSGKWKFYWAQHLDPQRISSASHSLEFNYIDVPGSWNKTMVNRQKIPGTGYATYHLKVYLKNNEGSLALKFLDMATSYAVFINGRRVDTVGNPGRSPAETIPFYHPKIIEFRPESDNLDIVVHVSNFHHWQGGMWETILLGNPQQLGRIEQSRTRMLFFSTGVILVIGLYHIILFVFHMRDRSNLFFGIFCFLIVIRILLTGERVIIDLIPGINFEQSLMTVYIAFYLCIPCFAMYTHAIFPKEFPKKFTTIVWITALAFTMMVFVLPSRLYTNSMPVYQGLSVLALIYGAWATCRAILKKRKGAAIFALGFVILFICTINDILYTRQLINTGHLFPFGILVFIFLQAMLLAQKFSSAFTMVEEQKNELQLEISERRKAENALMKSHELFKTVMDSIDATIYVSDMDTYEIIFANQHMKNLFNDSLEGGICYNIFRNESQPCRHCTNAKLIDEDGKSLGAYTWEGQNPVTQKWYLNIDRAIKWVNGRTVRLQIATDITKLKQLEDELRQSHKMESIGTLAGGIAHDFNNILYMISGNAELLLDSISGSDSAHANAEAIRIASMRAAGIVKQLLNFSRKTDQDLHAANANDIIEDSIRFLRSSIPSTIDFKTMLNCPETVIMADSIQINQVLMNVCTNASQAMETSGGTLEIRAEEIDLDFRGRDKYPGLEKGKYLKIDIMDTGSGIAPDDIDKIFDPYFTTKETGKGSGMGLSVVHGIVKNHNGAIFVDSSEDNGSTFTIFFPLIDKKPQLVFKKTEKPVDGSESILFLDDEPAVAKMGTRMLKKLGYRVRSKTDPAEALALFLSEPKAFDLVITDMTMPKMNGAKFSKKLLEVRPEIPIIICSGYSSQMDEGKARKAGIRGYIMKPVSISEMAKAIREVLDE